MRHKNLKWLMQPPCQSELNVQKSIGYRRWRKFVEKWGIYNKQKKQRLATVRHKIDRGGVVNLLTDIR